MDQYWQHDRAMQTGIDYVFVYNIVAIHSQMYTHICVQWMESHEIALPTHVKHPVLLL
jgi:hypothetical protein